MKRRLTALLLCLCLMLAIVQPVWAEGPVTGTVYGLNDGVPLRVRSAPVDGDKVDELYNGDVVTILATSEDGGWYQVMTPKGITGWSSAEFIRINEPQSTEPTPMEGSGTVYNINSGSKLYVYKEADRSSKVLEKLDNDATVTLMAVSYDKAWYQVTTAAGTVGWCNASYVRIDKIYQNDEAFEAHLTEQGFPEDYKEALRVLYAHHPNWEFIAEHTAMTFAEAVEGESEVGLNALIYGVDPEAWLSMEYGAYNWTTNTYVEIDSGGWATASSAIIAHYMDPRNFLNFKYIYQFEDLSSADGQTTEGIKAILPSHYDGYAEDLLKAAKDANVSAYFLATRMTQEGAKVDGTFTGDDGVNYDGYYNFFNIGSYAGSQHGSYHGANTNGAIYAKKQGWDTPYKCMLGGAQFLGRNYIHKKQNTGYYQKFNVVGDNLYHHQYMTNLYAPSSESNIRAQKITAAELAGKMTFVIPVYKEMPEEPAAKPNDKGNNNNFLDNLTVEGFSLSPTFNRYTMEYSVAVSEDTTQVTVTATPNSKEVSVSGGGTVYLQKGENRIPITVTATSGAQRTYTLVILCEADVPDPPVPPVTPTPTITGTAYTVGETVTKVEPNTAIADFINALVLIDGTAKIVAADGSEKAEGSVATGDTLQVYDNDGKLCQSVPVLIYGDVNSDGQITSQDLRRIQRHILAAATLEGHPLSAADANKDGNITSQDLRRIQRYILGALDSINKEG